MKTLLIIAVVVGCAVLAFGTGSFVRRMKLRWSLLLALFLGISYTFVLIYRPSPLLVGGLVGGLAASMLGALLGARVVPTLPALTAFLVTASIMDVVSVRSGMTRALFDEASHGDDGLVYFLLVLLPWEEGFIPVIGVSDLFGLAVIFAALVGMGAGRVASFFCGLSGILLALAAGLILGGVPAYPLLAAIALPLAVWTHRRNRREGDRTAVGEAGLKV